MRKLFSILFLGLFPLALFAQYGGADGDFNPENPDNPEPAGVYSLRVQSQSAEGGTTNFTNGKLMVGESIHLFAYPAMDYDFREWQRDGKVLTTSRDFTFTMPAKDVVLMAVFEFNPQSPDNPGANNWDDGSGTLIIDQFTTGSLSDAIYIATDGQPEEVKKLIVSGQINDEDVGALKLFTSIEVIDLSRCYGAITVPAYSFSGNDILREISLPASIRTIETHAFSSCSNLTYVDCYSVVPPVLGDDVFEGSEGVKIRVPSDSKSIYQLANLWKELTIIELGATVYNLEIDLPDDYEDGRYNNMYIDLVNELSGQKMTYLIASGVQAYTFKNLRPDTKWTAYVRSADGQVLGCIEGITIGKANMIKAFESLLAPQTLTAQVLAGGTDVTSRVQLTWLSAEGTYLGKGASIDNVLPIEGATVTLRCSLPDDLVMNYQMPEDFVYLVQPSNNHISFSLTPLSRIELKGKVVDEDSGEGISGVPVIVAQTLYERYTKNFSAKTDTEGAYIIQDAYNAPTTVTASATDYTSVTDNYSSFTLIDGTASFNDITLKNLKQETNTTVRAKFTYVKSAVEGQQGHSYPFADTLNVVYTIYNGMERIQEFKVQGTEIVVTEKVPDGSQLLFTAESKTGAFAPLSASCTVIDHQAEVRFTIKEQGQILATYVNSEAATVKAILYDANGKFVRSGDYTEQSILFSDLPQGIYSLVSMSRSKMFNAIYDLSKYAENGLEKDKDYVVSTIMVSDGVITQQRIPFVPYLDESRFDFMSEKTSFSVNKTLTTVGNNLTLTTLLDFKETYAQHVSEVKLVVDLAACNLVNGSVMVGNEVAGYEYSDNQVVIPVNDLSGRVRFCVQSDVAGDYAPTASVQFLFDDQVMTKPIGQVSFTLEKLGISVPATISTNILPVSGTAMPRSQVWIYDDNELIGLTMALSNGSWSQTCELLDPIDFSEHHIYAAVKNGSEESQTETMTVWYEKEAAVVKSVTMLNTACPASTLDLKQYKTVFDFMTAQTRIEPYWYWPDYPEFTFLVEFTEEQPYDNPSDVELFVYTSDRQYRILTPTRYDSNHNAYVVTSRFYTDALPISVNVRKKGDAAIPAAYKPYVEYVLDPSGYVYEGVPSNRLEGVTATIYYRKTKDAPATLWDASLYDQENPVLTDEYGMYAWDVPEGWWQIKFEKAGYETTWSELLPVPPPQLNINIPMVQSTAPKVKSVKADKEGIDIEFDKYMLVESLAGSIFATKNGNLVEGSLQLLNAEGMDENDANPERYASRIRYIFEKEYDTKFIHLTINSSVKSYAGLSLENTYSEDEVVDLQVKSISVDEVIAVQCEGEKELIIEAIPSDAAAGKTLRVKVLSTMIADVKDGVYAFVFNQEGQAAITLKGDVPGSTALQFSIDDANVKAQTLVNVTEAKMLVSERPKASRNTGAEVYRGTLINLTSDDEGAKIYYTVTRDGSEPADPVDMTDPKNPLVVGNLYTAPIAINADKVNVKAVAKVDGYTYSEVSAFEYHIMKSAIELNLKGDWTWVSHNMADNILVSDFKNVAAIQEVKSQTRSAIRDEVYGLMGNLRELSPAEAYKIRVSEPVAIPFYRDAYNATKLAINLNRGWNWIGYPNYQEMTLNEALTYLDATEGDMLVSQGGTADFVNGAWQGDLQKMTPGVGYMLKVANASALLYNTDMVSTVQAYRHGRLKINHTPWEVDEHAYPDVMPMRAQLFCNETLTEEDEYTVAAFADTECRGIGSYVNGVIYLTIHGQGPEEISFMAVNNATNEIVNIQETVSFRALETVGSYYEPFALHFETVAVGIREIGSLQATDDRPDIYNLAGQRVNGKLSRGIYIVNGKKVAIK